MCTPQARFYPEVGQVNLQLKALWYHDRVPSESQPILYGQLITHAESEGVSVLEHAPPSQAILKE